MESNQFLQWLDEMFIPHIKKIGGHHILLLDGHNTHVSLSVALKCKENNITLACIPAHSPHIQQPLNVSVFCHVKDVWRDILTKFYAESGFNNLSKKVFTSLVAQLYSCDKAYTCTQNIAGFESSNNLSTSVSFVTIIQL